jgi:protein xylosyltransferase
MIAATLHGAAILLRQSENWDWFINLSASDYPLITQDGMTCCTSVLLPSVLFSPQASGPLI